MKVGLSYSQGRPKDRFYADVLRAAGERFGIPVEPIWLAGIDQPLYRAQLENVDGIVLTGGADVDPRRYGYDDAQGLCRFTLPKRDEDELPIVEFALEHRLPTLAICRGMQFLNVVCGGTLIPDLPGHDWDDDSRRHIVSFEPGSWLSNFAPSGEGLVSSSHHQAVDRPGRGLSVAATSPDGIAEAMEWADPDGKAWLLAVQWHPERMSLDEPLSGELYRAFLEEVLARNLEKEEYPSGR